LLDAIDIEGKDITADALLTQRTIADYLVRNRHAHYHFTVKNNQPGLFEDIALYFEDRKNPDFVHSDPPDHGRIETRKIWTTTELNAYLDFPHVGQTFMVQRETTNKKSGEYSCEIAYGITSRTPHQADPKRVLTGVLKTAAITSSTGTMTKIAAASESVMGRKISPDYDDLPSASSNPNAFAV
jgi:predicted transposase YbfD/YdcC